MTLAIQIGLITIVMELILVEYTVNGCRSFVVRMLPMVAGMELGMPFTLPGLKEMARCI